MSDIDKLFSLEQEEFIKSEFNRSRNISRVTALFTSKYLLNPSYKEVEKIRKRISRYFLKNGITSSTLRLESSPEFKEANVRELDEKRVYITTWQQNGTTVDKKLWQNIKSYAKYHNAEISVILGRYKVSTDLSSELRVDEWDSVTKEYWDTANHEIGDDLVLMSSIKVTPTNRLPLTNIHRFTTDKSIVIGSPKLHMKVCPTVDPHHHKVLYTTGAITDANYGLGNSGELSNLTHKKGFVIIEVDKDVTHVRQVEVDEDSSFVDLWYKVSEGVVTQVDTCKGMVCGDSHHWHIDPEIDKINDRLCSKLGVPTLVLHDVADGQSCNYFLEKSPTKRYLRYKDGQHLIEKELGDLVNWLKKKSQNLVIPYANHNVRFDRVLDNDWRNDIPNSLFYLDYTAKLLRGDIDLDRGVVPYYLNKELEDSVKCLSPQESFKLGKYECGLHGDWGTNGSKGSASSFRNLGIPLILAHTHTPYRADDCIYVGTNTKLSLDYTGKGLSSWVQANAIVTENGLAQLILFKDKRFTTFDF